MRLRSAAGAWLLARMVAWRLALPLLKRILSLPRLVRLAASRARPGASPFSPAQVVSASHRLFPTRTPTSGDCLERSLLTYRFLLDTGAAPQLNFGVARTPVGLAGHAWVILAGAPVDESPESLARYSELVSFTASGAPR
jgi:hypothetical protein